VTLHAVPPQGYGAALQQFTGSERHNLALQTRYGTLPPGKTEEDIYAALRLPWIPPELREDSGEIEAAAEGRLPRLVELSQIRGDLHMHTTESDGRATLEEMAEAARALGYEYIAITDHSKALAMANGLDEKRAIAFAARVRDLDLGIRIFSGIECDIRKDGSMDLDDEALTALDIVVGSVHSYMNLEPAEQTDRLLRALECQHLRILGHPTGRLLLRRESFAFDFERVAAEAARRGVWLEVNSSPERLDLSAPLLRAAKPLGAKFVISTDAHHPQHLAGMRYGVVTARRGWLEAADVLNTLPLDKFAAMIS
jgi:DNA polymerase (family 10)